MKLRIAGLLLFIAAETHAGAPAAIPESHRQFAEEARTLFNRGDFQGAERVYERLLIELPDNVTVLSNLALFRLRAGRWKEAEAMLRRAVALAPKEEFTHGNLGVALYQQGRFDEAISELEKALVINPASATVADQLKLAKDQKQSSNEIPTKPFVGDIITPLEESRRKSGR